MTLAIVGLTNCSYKAIEFAKYISQLKSVYYSLVVSMHTCPLMKGLVWMTFKIYKVNF